MKEIILAGDIDLENAFLVKENLTGQLHKSPEGIVINLRNVRNIDSTGLGILVSILKKARKANKRIELTNINSGVKEVFSLTMLDRLFNI